MGMVVRSNIMAVNAQRQLGMNNSQVSKSLEKLSSGYRINRAGDDASGLAISEKMKAQIKGLDTASLNAQDAISLVQTAEGALTETHNMLNRMVELATRSANGINNTTNRQQLQSEIDELIEEIDRIATSTTFNDMTLLDGAAIEGMGTIGGGTNTATKAEFTAPQTVAIIPTDGQAGATKASFTIDVANFEGKAAGDVLVKVGDLELGTVTITEGMTDEEFAKEVEKLSFDVSNEAGNKIAFKGTATGTSIKFEADETTATAILLGGTSATSNGTNVKAGLTLTAVEPAADTPATAAAGDPAYVKDTTFDFDFSTIAQPTAGNKITIAGKEFEFQAAGGGDPTKVEISATDIKGTIDNLAAAIAADTTVNGKFDVTAKDGVLTFKAKDDAVTGDAAPEVGAATTWNAAKAVTATVVPPDPGEDDNTTTGGGKVFILQIGDKKGDLLEVKIGKMDATGVGVKGLDIKTRQAANDAIETIKKAIDDVSTQRATLGAKQNRLEYTINNLDTASENIQAANSRIRDTDMAKMMMEFTKINVVTQSAQAMLAQANQQPQSVLQLLQ